MKPPHHIAGASFALALAACSSAQTGSTVTVVPSMVAPQAASVTGAATPSVKNGQQIAGGHKAPTALILVANNPIGELGTISEYAETATGNVAPTSVIPNHNGGPTAIAFSASNNRFGITNGNIDNSLSVGAETFSLFGDIVTEIECFPKPSQTNGIAFDSKSHIYVSAFLPAGGRGIEVFASGANSCAKPKRTISDEGGLAIDSNDLLYVANSTTATIDAFPLGSGTMTAQIGGSNTGLVAPGTVAVDASRNLYVFDNTTATISEFAAGATGNVAPIRTVAGSNTGLTIGDGFNCALAVSKHTGNIFVSNPTSNAILVFAATASGNVAPIQTIAGSATQISNPLGITVTE
jgi:hypothetical protein